MTETNKALNTITHQRLLTAAISCFAKLGYNGVSTREIARLGEINEVTIYRYYATKKDLFMAAVESEVKRMRFRADLLGKLNSAPDLQAATHTLIELFSDAIAQDQRVVRLLHFSVLEFGAELHPIFLKHMREVLDAMSESLSRVAKAQGITNLNERAIVLAIVSSVASLDMLYPLIWGDTHKSNTEAMKSTCQRLWSAVLLPATSREANENNPAAQNVTHL